MELVMFCVVFFAVIICLGNCQLVVNVRNNGGDIYRETIEANTTLDSISLDFRKSDGTLITQFIDGRNEVHIFRAVILPEEDLGQTEIQTICFVLRFAKNEFISSDAMSKLRQKNPSTIRHPEEVRGSETFDMDLTLNVAASHIISSHISRLCHDAADLTFARTSDLRLLAQILNRDYSILQSVTHTAPTVNLTSCTDSKLHSRQPCLCHYDICVGWYPCGLKYCRGKDSAGRIVSYRCGIRTCSRCRQFEFRVSSKSLCVWDEAEFQPYFMDSLPLQGVDDPLDVHAWRDDVLSPRFLNDTLQQRINLASSLDVGAADHVVKMNHGLVNGDSNRHKNVIGKASALDDDEDVD